jgi:hypothetical protein
MLQNIVFLPTRIFCNIRKCQIIFKLDLKRLIEKKTLLLRHPLNVRLTPHTSCKFGGRKSYGFDANEGEQIEKEIL